MDQTDNYEVLFASGTMTTASGFTVNDSLRVEIIKAALYGDHAHKVRQSLRKRRPITFHDAVTDLTVHWTPTLLH